MRKIINKLKLNKPGTLLFIFSFFYLLILGITLSYNLNIGDNYDLLFSSDTKRVIIDATIANANHYRIDVHPLFLLLVQPIVILLSGITVNKMLSIIILSALTSSISIFFIYKILDLIKKDDKTNIMISILYLLSFSNMIYTSGIETYNFACLFLILLLYFILKKYNEKFNNYTYILLIILGVLSLSFVITNFIVFLIVLFMLLINKKINIKNSILVVLVTLISLLGLSLVQKLIWPGTPLVFKNSISSEITSYSKEVGIKNVIKNDYYNSLISSNVKLKMTFGSAYNAWNYVIDFIGMNIFNILVISILYILLIVLLFRNYTKNKFINTNLLLILLFNTVLHTIYGNNTTFLYSLHFLYPIILLLGINLNSEKSNLKKYIKYYLYFFVAVQFITNNYIFIKVFSLARKVLNESYIMANIGAFNTILLEIFVITIIFILIGLLIYIIMELIKNKNKEKKILLSIFSILIIILINCIFLHINNVPNTNRLFIVRLGNNSGETIPISRLELLDKELINHFKNEVNEYINYQTELLSLRNDYSVDTAYYIIWNDYYYFGMGNRNKLMFKDNSLYDLTSSKELYSFKIKDYLIIPNIYTVIIETEDNDFIKIFEDNEGVHLSVNEKDTIIDGTDNYIELYNFDNQKNQNIKKELYGEILFNIKDSKIYPNITVYNNVWYRDAALVSMVLKNTNNTDLISDWVNNITEIYDLQNKGNKETDNLGELLYILSTQENRNEELINKIEEEANSIASSNTNGYYLYGKTDYNDEFLYQNLWYKLGIESVGRDFTFDLDIIPKDNYSKMSWWSDYHVDGENESSVDYPYLTTARFHKLRKGEIIMNVNSYPLSWEMNGSEADYSKNLNERDVYNRLSSPHSWAASELLLLLLDDSGDLNIK